MSLIQCKECGEMISSKASRCPRCGCPITENRASGEYMLPVGTILGDGRYRIEQHLASGGFGNTYIATDLTFNDHVAVKEFFMRGVTLRNDDDTVGVNIAENQIIYQEQLEKFKKEAMRLRRLNNPHIVRVQDLFEANGTAYYVMDYVKGESLAARMRRTGQPLSEDEAMRYFSQVLDALQAVHAEGLCHLDIKPANILVDNDGNAVLIDFGASKQMAGGNATSMTKVAYTNGYAPIEQIEQDVQVVEIIQNGLLHALAHCLAGSEVDDARDARLLLEQAMQGVNVGTVALHKDGANASDALDTVDNIGITVAQVVNNYHLVASILQFHGGVRTDKASSACN